MIFSHILYVQKLQSYISEEAATPFTNNTKVCFEFAVEMYIFIERQNVKFIFNIAFS